MTKELKLDVKKTGLPIKIGDMEFFFAYSIESVERHEKVYKDALKEVENIETNSDNVGDEIKAMKEALTVAYDALLGQGTFDKLYAEYGDVMALSEVLLSLCEGIDAYCQTELKKQDKNSEKLLSDYKKKKKAIKKGK